VAEPRFGRVVLICGSRSWTDADAIAARIADEPNEPIFITGGCPTGADCIAEAHLDTHGLFRATVPAPWNRWGKQAGFARNSAMLRLRPDLVIAFWDGKSRGTHDTITKAKRLGISVEVLIAAAHRTVA
jgi:hypothetical protein